MPIADTPHAARRTLLEVQQVPVIEDFRGVDVSQIRRQLSLSVEDRVRHMVEVTNTLMHIRATVQFVDPPPIS